MRLHMRTRNHQQYLHVSACWEADSQRPAHTAAKPYPPAKHAAAVTWGANSNTEHQVFV